MKLFIISLLAFILLLILQFKGIYLLHPYYVFTGIIGSLGLTMVAHIVRKEIK